MKLKFINKPPKPKKIKPKDCGNPTCTNKFTPRNSLDQACCAECFWKIAQIKLDAKKKKEHQVWKRDGKESLMTTSDYEKLLEKEINAIVRLIDKGCNCISCKPGVPIQKIFAGHFRSVKSNPSIRYNLHNIHRQCYSCNGNKGGAQVEYLDGLEREYGKEYAEYVHYTIRREFTYMNWKISDLKEWTNIARLIKKELTELGNNYTTEERIAVRNEMNFRLGIYKTEL